jgi:hypothetical protein
MEKVHNSRYDLSISNEVIWSRQFHLNHTSRKHALQQTILFNIGDNANGRRITTTTNAESCLRLWPPRICRHFSLFFVMAIIITFLVHTQCYEKGI